MFDKYHLTFYFKSKVSRDVFKNKNECQSTSTFPSKMSLQCHMPSSMCHFKFLKCQLTYGFFLTSHTTCQNLNCACQLTSILFSCKFLCVKCQKLAKTLSNIYIVCKSNRLHVDILRFSFIKLGVYSIDSSKMVGNFLVVLNFNRLFLKINRFICN